MSAAEQKKITIRLPEISFRFFALCFLGLCSVGALTYYVQAVRPYLWISSAKIDAFSSTISSDIAGRIVEMGPSVGDGVVKGQTLFSLDRELLYAKRAHLKGVVDVLNEQICQEKDRMGKAMEEYISASADLELGIGSPDAMKKHLVQMQEAQAKSEATTSRLTTAQAELAALDLQTQKMVFTAPFNGVIVDRTQNPGSVISLGEPVYTLTDVNNLWVEANLPEKELSRVKLGTLARVQVAAYPDREWHGKVTWIGPAATAEAIPVKISLENPGSALKPGLSAKIGLKVR